MVNIESAVFDTVYRAVKEYDSTVDIESEYQETPVSFPHVSIEEDNNTTYLLAGDMTDMEQFCRLFYQINIYTVGNGRKSKARAIAGVIDTAMRGMGFAREAINPIPNIDRSAYRLNIQYDGIVSKGMTEDGDTHYYVARG